MRRTIIIVLLLAQTITLGVVHGATPIPAGFHGEWVANVVTDEGFPWWTQVKYPVRLTISEEGVSFEAQRGGACKPTVAFYDSEIEALVIRPCGETKSPNAFPPYYKVRLNEERLCGEVWTHRKIFSFVAHKVDTTD